MAAQQLTGNGFTQVINLSGGIKAWTGQRAFDDEEHGLELFMNLSDPIEVLSIAYSLEEGLQDFYKTMAPRAKSRKAADIFNQLASIEDLHKDRLFAEYTRITGLDDREEFQADLKRHMLEGALTTEEYLQRFGTDLEKVDEVIGIAIAAIAFCICMPTKAFQPNTAPKNSATQTNMISIGRFMMNSLVPSHRYPPIC